MQKENKGSGIAVLGSVLVDKINVLEKYPSMGQLAKISEIEVALGGLVPNVAIDLKRIDPTLPVTAGGRVGADSDGELVRSTLRQEGVDISALVTDSTCPTSFTQVMSVKGGQRTFFTFAGASARYGIEDIDFDALNAKILHLGYFLLLDRVDSGDGVLILKEAKKRGIITSIDLVSENSDRYKNVTNCLPFVDYLIINEYEAGMLTGIEPTNDSLGSIAERLMEMGVNAGVVIHKPDLSVILTERGFTYLGSYELPSGYIKGTTGAGDAFCAGALYGIAGGFTDMEILEFASSCAAVSLASQGATAAMRSYDEINKICKKFGRKTICL
jgi:sugar/nucleoside kinase (ribokinase family)